MSKELTREMLQVYLQKNGKKSFRDIAREFRVPIKQNTWLTQFLNNLVANNYLFVDRENNAFYVQTFVKIIKGTIKINKPQYGFIENEENPEESFYVGREYFNSAYDGDTVEARIYEVQGRMNAIVTKIFNHKEKTIIGKLINNAGFFEFVGYYQKDQFQKFKIDNALTFDMKANWLVSAKVLRYHKTYLTVELIKNICSINDNAVNVEAKLNSFDIDLDFNEQTMNEAIQLPDEVSADEIKNRRDFRNELLVTIDGDDTKDFDDAISIEQKDNGFVLKVHIADVSYYVKENGAIDKEALKRGTSIYLADRVIPMLPEKLSNGICSLNPGVDRCAMSAIIDINFEGETTNIELFESVIQSKYRLTYSKVNEFYENPSTSDYPQEVKDLLNKALALSKILRSYKETEGYVNFEIEEPKIILNEDNTVKDIVVKNTGFSENMIEDFMVRANESVALKLAQEKLPVMYRIHEQPDIDRIENTNKNLATLGIKNRFQFPITSLEFAETVHAIEKENNEQFLKIFFLRTMPKAIYSTENLGHFGLASQNYCHFTSPIRRYPDLVIHRTIRDWYLSNKKPEDLQELTNKIESEAQLNSASEQEALNVERSTNDIRYAEFYSKHVGQSFKGKVSTILKFGLFLELETHVSVLLHVKNMLAGEYVFNEETTTLELSGHPTYHIGDELDVTISTTYLKDGKIDCVLTSEYSKYIEQKNQRFQPRNNKPRDNKFKKDRFRK